MATGDMYSIPHLPGWVAVDLPVNPENGYPRMWVFRHAVGHRSPRISHPGHPGESDNWNPVVDVDSESERE